MKTLNVIVAPGMGCTPITRCNWYKWFANELKERGIHCKLREFPNAQAAKESEWMPFLRSRCGPLGKVRTELLCRLFGCRCRCDTTSAQPHCA